MAYVTLRQARQLELSGWTRVDLDPARRYEPADSWARNNCSRYHSYGWQYWFEQEKDAVVFALRWS